MRSMSFFIDGTKFSQTRDGEERILTLVRDFVKFTEKHCPNGINSIIVTSVSHAWSGTAADELWPMGGSLVRGTFRQNLAEDLQNKLREEARRKK